jgi:hypothetical protein
VRALTERCENGVCPGEFKIINTSLRLPSGDAEDTFKKELNHHFNSELICQHLPTIEEIKHVKPETKGSVFKSTEINLEVGN